MLAVAFAWFVWSTALAPQTIELDAQTRSSGNRRPQAVALARTLLRTSPGPAQILHVRVDGAGAHDVAGVMLEGRPKRPLKKPAFFDQVQAIVLAGLAAPGIEEIDVWAVVPIEVPPGAVVSGPMAVPTTKTVFAGTFRRSERDAVAAKLHERRGIYVDPAWERTLLAEGPASGAANRAGLPPFYASEVLDLGIVP